MLDSACYTGYWFGSFASYPVHGEVTLAFTVF